MSPLMNEDALVRTNERVGPNLYEMNLDAPQIAREVRPGQFVHIKLPGMEGHILRRPFSVYNTDRERGSIDILYQKVGYGTDHMSTLEQGSKTSLIGPIGHGWCVPLSAQKVLLVGGGVGSAPLYMLAAELKAKGVDLDIILGAQTKDALVSHSRYVSLLSEKVSCSTDDGTFGHAGFCTPLVKTALDLHTYDFLACCGPEPLMKLVVGMASEAKVPCQVSLERRMACGVGACLSCVVETDEGKKRACVDGPVFDAQKVIW